MTPPDSWNEWKQHVLKSLERIEEQGKKTETEVQSIRLRDIAALKIEISLLKLKNGFWGAAGGAAAVGVIYSIQHFGR